MNRLPDLATLKRLERVPHTTLQPWHWDINENDLPFRYWLYMVAQEYGVEVAVELGVNLGRTTCMLAAGVLDLSIGVDIDPNWEWIDYSFGTLPEAHQHKVRIVEGDSGDLETAQKVAKILGPKTVDLLFVDSLHTVEHVEKELRLFGPMLAPVALVVMDDLNQPPELYELLYTLPGTHVELDWLHPLLGDPRGPSCGFAAVIVEGGLDGWISA